MPYRFADTDLRLLQVFKAVVESRGFTNAQAILNVGQSTISHQIRQLETRLGIRLCERGRSGFRLTPAGERVFAEAMRLFKAHEQFSNATAELRKRLVGYLNIAVVDNVITDPGCPITAALAEFNRNDHEVNLRLEVLHPADMERLVLSEDLDLAIGPFHHSLPGLDYRFLYGETEHLMCGRSHPLYQLRSGKAVEDAIRKSPKVLRGYLHGGEFARIEDRHDRPNAVTQIIEASAILILGGSHIGFLPAHYCDRWVKSGEMRRVAPQTHVYKSRFHVVTRSGQRKNAVLTAFLKALEISLAKRERMPPRANPQGRPRAARAP